MNLKSIITTVSLAIFSTFGAFSQIIIEGYTFETGNRGFLSQVTITAENAVTGDFIQQVTSDVDGKFVIDVQPGINSIKLIGMKDLFHETEVMVDAKDATAGKSYVKMELKRSPGYIFEITVAEKADSIGSPTNHIRNALIEVYNNTKKEVVLVYEDHPQPDFKVDLEKGNHYTVMIRKKGYLTKRMEAFVNVAGCILCFEGIGQITPGVSDNLSEANSMGTLLANVELEPLFEGKRIELPNIYYDLNSDDIRPDAAEELMKAATFLKDNPQITVELGSHTDSRGKAANNMELSVRRAQSAVEYLVKNGDVEAYRINPRGYGEGSPFVKCGSNCTEDEHARNRRSEIKVLGISPDIPYKSLEKIKFEEGFDDMIAALQEEGQVKIPEDGELPEDIEKAVKKGIGNDDGIKVAEQKADMEAEMKSDHVKTNTTDKMVTNGTAEHTVTEEASMSNLEKRMLEKANQRKANNRKKNNSAIVKKATVQEVNEVNSPATETAVVEKEIMPTKSTVSSKKSGKEMAEADKIVATKRKESRKMAATTAQKEYTGHKIVVAFRRSALEKSHELYATYPDLSVYQAKAGYFLYMTGDFQDPTKAEERLNTLKVNNPNVYLVEFDNGNRVN